MGAQQRIGVVVACALGFLIAPGVAAAERYRGGTSQKGGEITLRTNAKGVLTKGTIQWRARCRHGGTVRSGSDFFRPFDRSGPGGFRDAGQYRARSGKYSARFRAAIAGHRDGDRLFNGDFHISVRYYKNGKYVTTCRSGHVKWSASAKRRSGLDETGGGRGPEVGPRRRLRRSVR